MNSINNVHNANNGGALPAEEGSLEFLDFGCGTGKSMAFASSLAPGPGSGLDKSEDAILACRAKGYAAQLGDVLTYDRRNVAATTFAIDLMQELPGRHEFTAACVNIVRGARNFAVIQHSYFDIDMALAPLGLCCEANFGKKITYKPTLADYLWFARSHAKAVGIIGMGAFIFGEPLITPVFDGDKSVMSPDIIAARTMRIVIARKDPRRFRQALEKVGIGHTLFLWMQE